MLAPLRPNNNRSAVLTGVQVPFPWRGLNARDRLEVVGNEYAQIIDNLNIVNGQGEVRNGFDRWALCSDTTADVKALLQYNGAGADKLFACCGGKIENVTSGNPASSDLSGLTSDEWMQTMYSTTSGTYMIIANGSDDVRHYNGTTWTAPVITGVTSSDLDCPFAHKGRLWFVESGTTSVWYLAANAIAGAATEFPIGALLQRGGSVLAINSWSSDSGQGLDDRIVFITTEGEVVIYAGVDPSTDYELVGIFQTARPVGKNCFTRFSGELTIYTTQGPKSLAEIVAGTQSKPDSFGDIVRPDFEDSWRTDSAQYGWQAFTDPNTGWLFFNVPWASEGEVSRQYIYQSGAWVRHIHQPAYCWGASENVLYFGGANGAVYKAYTGQADANYDGTDKDIVTEVVWGWSQFGVPTRKRFVGARIALVVDVETTPAVEMMTNYSLSTPVTQPTIGEILGATWDEAVWDRTAWADGYYTFTPFIGLFRIGEVGALRIRNSFQGPEYYRIQGATVYFEVGGVL